MGHDAVDRTFYDAITYGNLTDDDMKFLENFLRTLNSPISSVNR